MWQQDTVTLLLLIISLYNSLEATPTDITMTSCITTNHITPIMPFNVNQNRQFWHTSKACMQLPLANITHLYLILNWSSCRYRPNKCIKPLFNAFVTWTIIPRMWDLVCRNYKKLEYCMVQNILWYVICCNVRCVSGVWLTDRWTSPI